MTKLSFASMSRTLFLAALTLLLAGCQIDSEPKSELDQIRARGVLRVGTLNNQLSYYIGPDGPSGLDYELAREFARELGVKLEMKPAYRLSSLFPALKNGEIDIIAAGLSQSEQRLKDYRAGPAYYYVSQQVVYKKGQWRPRSIEQLIAKQDELYNESGDAPIFSVVNDSHFESTLESLKSIYPEFRYYVDNNADVNDLLKQVSQGELKFTMADSVEISLSQRIYPDIATAFEMTEDQPISWFMRRSDDESLYAMMIEFFGNLKQSGSLASLEEKYIGHVGTFDYVDTRAFLRALDTRLPKWMPLFQKYSEEFDWRLIAALAYQESHWNPSAKSPTGVRGMMMLTLPTARSVDVTNRLNPEQSVRGGVEYLRRMMERIPDSIPDHEKIWFALASYNVGYGHMMDARRLTKLQGGSPDAWADVKDRLPQLRQKKYFAQTRYGYARGDEALSYVENIRRYYQSIIGHMEQKHVTTVDSGTDDLTVITPEEEITEDESDIDAAVESSTETSSAASDAQNVSNN
ncbi:membrane-bound lytic murein transglycosylase MltF [Vibrio fluvialis]|uniref:membrane-bound lytic murein transglycosylase MltF n=1 Tax=Vibrio fluvialis TaxID=676 RepID=UPI00192A7BC0|nr:membrane-bound lytic murein transglycosylase MltF [Vibrio fluvialis]MBL4247764.1 membrane-bound lytic murein transglycosylase MltF [Vibrio fluvialis]MBL4256174.1 membrane-bound lytic murein transglycosylase MltF [Vibrio fluvialis]MBY7790470.1 membrane-bound lytic murein transglycosylase MltF [Vibrio fluvialis]MBY8057295.1 membrane-bound lytic murein transglycosylase MltF [Vibrio fluvialis]